jgi:serine/threonine-protein kinase PknG
MEDAEACLESAEKNHRKAADHDWRVAWHHGLLALAKDQITDAQSKFDDVYRALPGEDAPKLALGFCYERSKPDDAQQYFEAVWRRDHSQASAALGLARICLQCGDRKGAVAILDEVPEVSKHYYAARIAAVRILAGRLATGPGNGLPTVNDFSAVVSRLGALHLDGGDKDGAARDRLTAAVREIALAWVRETGGDGRLDGRDILGKPVCERGLRELLERSFRSLAARQAHDSNDHGVLIDLANAVRPRTTW